MADVNSRWVIIGNCWGSLCWDDHLSLVSKQALLHCMQVKSCLSSNFTKNEASHHKQRQLSCAVPENIHTPPPTEGIGISWGEGGGFCKAKKLKKCMKLNWNFKRGGGLRKNPFCGGAVFPPDCAIARIPRFNHRRPPENGKRANLTLYFYKATGLTQA